MTTQDHDYDAYADEGAEPTLDAHFNPSATAAPGALLIPEAIPAIDPSKLDSLGKALHDATPVMKQGSSYLDFIELGAKVRAYFRGMGTYTKPDGKIIPQARFISQNETTKEWNQWHHSGAVLIRQLEGLPVDTAVEITYTGSKKHSTIAGATIKLYDVVVLQKQGVKAASAVSSWSIQRVTKARDYMGKLTADKKGALAMITAEPTDGGERELIALDEPQVAGFRRGCAAIFEGLNEMGKDEVAGKIAGASGDIEMLVAAMEGLNAIEKAINDSAPPF